MNIAQELRFPTIEEVDGFFSFDKMHAPRALRPLSIDLVVKTFASGFTQAQKEYDSPIVTSALIANHYLYIAFHPHPDEAVVEDRMTRYRGFLERTVPLVGKRWISEWFPLVRDRNEAERDRDYSTMSDEEIFAHYHEMARWMEQMWYIHGHINFALVTGTALSDLYNDVMEPADPTESYQILQGYHTRPVDAAHGLWNLSRVAKSNPILSKTFEENEPRELKKALATTQGGKAFLKQLEEYLYDFGWRADSAFELAELSWRDDPSIPLANIARYIPMGEENDPMVAFNKSVKRREERTAAIRDKLSGDPEKLANFERLFESAKYAYPLTEDHAFYLDQMGVSLLRRFILILGERLVARGCIEVSDDIFYLYDGEVRDMMALDTDYRALVVERKAHFEACAKITPPPILGTPPPPPQPDDFVDPFIDSLVTRLLGIKPPAEGEQDDLVVEGVAGSPGVYTGVARVVRSLEEATELQVGEVLVCEMTLPPWVPLFSVAGAVVADVGGIMSHCAIIAREFGVPNVVGSVDGTTRIETGQTITVDGSNGNVYLDGRSL